MQFKIMKNLIGDHATKAGRKLPGLNPIKLITPTPKFWSWNNYEKSLFQSYKTT
jgi:hypothetical protein